MPDFVKPAAWYAGMATGCIHLWKRMLDVKTSRIKLRAVFFAAALCLAGTASALAQTDEVPESIVFTAFPGNSLRESPFLGSVPAGKPTGDRSPPFAERGAGQGTPTKSRPCCRARKLSVSSGAGAGKS